MPQLGRLKCVTQNTEPAESGGCRERGEGSSSSPPGRLNSGNAGEVLAPVSEATFDGADPWRAIFEFTFDGESGVPCCENADAAEREPPCCCVPRCVPCCCCGVCWRSAEEEEEACGCGANGEFEAGVAACTEERRMEATFLENGKYMGVAANALLKRP